MPYHCGIIAIITEVPAANLASPPISITWSFACILSTFSLIITEAENLFDDEHHKPNVKQFKKEMRSGGYSEGQRRPGPSTSAAGDTSGPLLGAGNGG